MLSGKIAVVTGGSRGIGAAIVKKLASLGADVAVIYAGNEEKARAVCAECESLYQVRAQAYRCNVADFQEAKETVNCIKKELGNVHILVNNAGITRDGLLAFMKESDFDEVLDVNLKGTFNMIKHCTGLFIRNKGGAIINISSVVGMIGNAGQVNYAASKAGVIGLTKSVARELAAKGVCCNAIAPGFIATEMTAELPEQEKLIAEKIPLQRVGQVEDIANAVAFLATADYITGEVLRVDGGMAM